MSTILGSNTTPAPVPTASPSHRLPGLDGLRGVAILLVLSSHSQWVHFFPKRMGDALYRLTEPAGLFGVPVFFAISGFLITYLLLQAERKHGRIDLGHFWMKRAIRIGPPVLAYVAFIEILAHLGGPSITAQDLASVLLFFRDLVPGAPTTSHFWSLALEAQFYLFWPVLLMLTPSRSRLGLGIGLLTSFPVIRLLAAGFLTPKIYHLLDSILRFDFILAGCLLAISYPVWGTIELPDRKVMQMRIAGIVICGISLGLSVVTGILCLGTGLHGISQQLTTELITLLGYVGVSLVLMSLLRNPKTCPSVINSRVFVWVGTISYSLYVWQQFFMFSPYLPVWMNWVASKLVLSFIVGWISYHLLEKPFTGLRKKLTI